MQLSLSDLLALRQWLCNWETSVVLESKEISKAIKLRKEVDKEIWAMTISEDTPWGKVTDSFYDVDFYETVSKLFGKSLTE